MASLVSAPIEIERALMPVLEESLKDYSKQEVQGAAAHIPSPSALPRPGPHRHRPARIASPLFRPLEKSASQIPFPLARKRYD